MLKKISIVFLTFYAGQMALGQGNQGCFHSTFEKKAFAKKEKDYLEILVASSPQVNESNISQYQMAYAEWLAECTKLVHKTKSPEAFLEKLFYKTHRKMLGWYTNYVSFNRIFDDSKYDCVTGTALFALLLRDLQIEHHIYEFDFHLFISLRLSGKEILIESTDPLDGFVTEASEIAARKKYYIESSAVDEPIHKTYIFRKITLEELCGLQYFNLAVHHFNKKEFAQAKKMILKAEMLYPSERIKNTQAYMTAVAQN